MNVSKNKLHVFLPKGYSTENAVIRLSDGRDVSFVCSMTIGLEPQSFLTANFDSYVHIHTTMDTMPAPAEIPTWQAEQERVDPDRMFAECKFMQDEIDSLRAALMAVQEPAC